MAGAVAATWLQRYVIILGTAFAGAWTMLVGGLALAFSHPWIALVIVVTATVLFAAFVWWVWRKVTRGARRLLSPEPDATDPGTGLTPPR